MAVTAAFAVLLVGEGAVLGADKGMVLSPAMMIVLGGLGAIGYCHLLERLEAVGGTVEIHGHPRGGTEVVLCWDARNNVLAQP